MMADLRGVLFEHQGELKESLAEQQHHIPRFLFRVSAPKTNGETTSRLVRSAAAMHKLDTSDLLSRPDAAEMLENHVLWKDMENDNLTSWTSSLLYGVHLAIHRKNYDRHFPQRPDPSRIKLYILEARRRPRGTFVPAVALLKAYGVSHPKLIHNYIHHEYLSQGAFAVPQTEMNIITYGGLIAIGLHELYPLFATNDKPKRLLLRVDELRQLFKETPPTTPTPRETEIAKSIATQWVSSNEIRVVIMATLLSLKRRFRNDPTTMQAFHSTGWCMSSSSPATLCH